MYLLLFILLPALTLTNGKPTLIASLGKLSYDETELDIVAIDPTNGNVSKLYTLPSLHGLDDDVWVCLRVDSERKLIYVLVTHEEVGKTYLYELSIADGHLLKNYMSEPVWGLAELYIQWDFNPDIRTLYIYGLCLNFTNTTLTWNYVWCSVKFDENGVGKTQHGF